MGERREEERRDGAMSGNNTTRASLQNRPTTIAEDRERY
jgi:hypothetical protein